MLPCFHEMFLKFTSIDSNSGFEVPEVADYKQQLIQITNETFRLVETVRLRLKKHETYHNALFLKRNIIVLYD